MSLCSRYTKSFENGIKEYIQKNELNIFENIIYVLTNYILFITRKVPMERETRFLNLNFDGRGDGQMQDDEVPAEP